LFQRRVLFGHHILVPLADLVPRFPALEIGKVAGVFHVYYNVTEDVLIQFHVALGFNSKKFSNAWKQYVVFDVYVLDQVVVELPQQLVAEPEGRTRVVRWEEHTSELQSREKLVCRL